MDTRTVQQLLAAGESERLEFKRRPSLAELEGLARRHVEDGPYAPQRGPNSVWWRDLRGEVPAGQRRFAIIRSLW